MNVKKLIGMLFVLLLFAGVVNAQTTFYVNNQSGDDANPGTSLLPKKTVGSALIAAPSGSIISVAYTAINYLEGNISTGGKTYTFTSTGGGTPVFENAAFSLGGIAAGPAITAITAANPAVVTAAGHGLISGEKITIYNTGDALIDEGTYTVTVLTANTFSIDYDNSGGADPGAGTFWAQGAATFTGPFQFDGGLNLFNGTLAGGDQLTVGTGVFRSEMGSITSGQLNYSAALPVTYDDIAIDAATGASTIVTGLELQTSTTLVGAVNVNTTSGEVLTLELDQNRTMGNGNTALTVAAGNIVDLMTFTLNVKGNNVAHAVGAGGSIDNGTLTFTMTGGNATIGGAVSLPNVVATSTDGTAAAPRLLTLAATSVTSLLAQSNSSITANAVATVNVAANTTTVVTNSSNGVITMNAAALTIHGNVLLNATGVSRTNAAIITFGGVLTINGDVTNSVGIAMTNAAVTNAGVIVIPDVVGTHLITGNVTLNGALSGTVTAVGANYTVNGGILLGGAVNEPAITINGIVTNSATSTVTTTTAAGTAVSGNMFINFANATAVVRADGGFVNSSAIPDAGTTTYATPNVNNGQIVFSARTTGDIGLVGTHSGNVVNNSVSTVVSNGLIDFRAAATGVFYGKSVSQGAYGKGGDITFGNHVINLSGSITSARTSTGADITVPAGAATRIHVISGSITNSGASDISIDLTGNDVVGLTGTLGNSGTGSILFPNAGTGAINVGAINISDGNINIAATHAANVTVTGTITTTGGVLELWGSGAPAVTAKTLSLLDGTVDLTGRTDLQVNGATQQIGGATTSPTFIGTADLEFNQPIPNVTQVITIGTADPTYTGTMTVNNTAVIPAPYVEFVSLGGTTTPANFYVLGDVTFVSSGQPTVINIVKIDNVRLNVGKNGVASLPGTADFQNTSGYVTANGGRVLMSADDQVQNVNLLACDAGATFGGFGIDNHFDLLPYDGAGEVLVGTASVFVGDFFLAEGEIPNTNITFTGVDPWPTIYRTEGIFITGQPTITAGTMINVTFYGGDKTASFEVPLGGTSLNNLSVETTNGAVPGHGVVTLGAATTVNGLLNINANQNLYTNNLTLTLKGANAQIYGNLVDDGTTRVQLAATTGTTFIGTGSLPALQVNNASKGNQVTGIPGLVSDGFGADNALGGGDDAFTTYDGDIIYQGGADTGSDITVAFTAVAAGNFNALTLSGDADEVFYLGANAVMRASITHPLGLISLGDYKLTQKGTAFAMTGGALITSSALGALEFVTTATNLTFTAGVGGLLPTIAANVNFNSPTGTINAPLAVNATITGNVTLFDNAGGTAGTTVDIPNGRTLTLGSGVVTVSDNSLFTTVATGILNLDVAAPNTTLMLNVPAATAVANLTISDNVTLDGAITGSTLTVGTAFVHNAGLFTFGTADLQVDGTFTRNGGTYAGDGWLIYTNGDVATGFQHSAIVAAGAMTINNLEINTADFTIKNARNLNVVKNLYLNGFGIINRVGATGPGYVFMGDADNVPKVTVLLPGTVTLNALQFVNANADFTFTGATGAVAANIWPATATLARNVEVNLAAAGNILTMLTRTVNTNLVLTRGIVQWDSPVVLTMADGSTLTRTNNGALDYDADLTAPTGTFTAGNLNLVYKGNVGLTGIEYSKPVIVNNFTMGTAAAASNPVTINFARSIDGVVTINNAASTLNVNKNTTFALGQTLPVGTIAVDAVPVPPIVLTVNGTTTLPAVTGWVTANGPLTFAISHAGGNVTLMDNITLVTGATFAGTSNLVFAGNYGTAAGNQNITVPATVPPVTIGGMTIQQTGVGTTVTLVGGNLNTSALTTFVNGIFLTGTHTLNLWHPFWNASVANPQGFNRAGVIGDNISHVYGNVAKTTVNAGIVGWVGTSEPRVEFPVGTMTIYRPAVITFGLSTSGGVPTVPNNTFTITHEVANPGGTAALPIIDGVKAGTDIARYPAFYWYIKAATSVDPSLRFDFELTPTGFTGFGANANDVRIIRRHGAVSDVANNWFLQGYEAGVPIEGKYDNEYNVSTGRFAVINRSSLAGLRADGATFTLGLATNLATDVTPVNATAKLANTAPVGNVNYVLNTEAESGKLFKNNVGTLRYTASSANETIATVSVSGTIVTVVPMAVGTAQISITAWDDANNDFLTYTFPVSIGAVGNEIGPDAIPTEYAISQNYPNPFNPTTAIRYALPKESQVTVKVYNMLAQEVATLVNEVKSAGYHTINFNANGLASGRYLAVIKAGEFTKTIKMNLLK